MVIIFVFWNISLKVCNNAFIMPSFEKKSSISTQCLKKTILLSLKMYFCTTLVVVKPKFSIQSL